MINSVVSGAGPAVAPTSPVSATTCARHALRLLPGPRTASLTEQVTMRKREKCLPSNARLSRNPERTALLPDSDYGNPAGPSFKQLRDAGRQEEQPPIRSCRRFSRRSAAPAAGRPARRLRPGDRNGPLCSSEAHARRRATVPMCPSIPTTAGRRLGAPVDHRYALFATARSCRQPRGELIDASTSSGPRSSALRDTTIWPGSRTRPSATSAIRWFVAYARCSLL